MAPTPTPVPAPSLSRGRSILRRAIAGLAGLALLIGSSAWLLHASTEPDPEAFADPDQRQRRIALSEVRAWLPAGPGTAAAEVLRAPADLVVVDPAVFAADRRRLLREAVTQEDGRRRIVLARLALAPRPADGGAGPLPFWSEAWQAGLAGSSSALLDRLMGAGFDGVVLENAGAYRAALAARPTAEADMVDLVSRIAERARSRNPAFLIVLQNAEELLAQTTLRTSIDGVIKTALLHARPEAGEPHDSERHPQDVAQSLHYLAKATSAGRAVLVVEHLADPAKAAAARTRLAKLGFKPAIVAPAGPLAAAR
jgi:endo-alpha-1,4-polygalactosaminidase (GH114 family)